MTSSMPLQIKITVVAATDLVERGVFRKPDPFAKITVGNQERFTKFIEGTTSPVWNQTFIIDAEPGAYVQVQIYDSARYQRRPESASLGIVTVRLSDLNLHNSDLLTYDLRKSVDNLLVSGRLVLQIGYNSPPRPTLNTSYTSLASPGTSRLPPSPGAIQTFPPQHPAWNSNNNGTSTAAPLFPLPRQGGANLTPNSSLRVVAPQRPPSPVQQPPRRSGPVRQNTISRAMEPTEIQRAREQHQLRSLQNEQEDTGGISPNDPLGPLPAGWFQREAPDGRIYFSDSNTRTTTWTDPRLVVRRSASSSSARAASSIQNRTPTTIVPITLTGPMNLGPLPSGWEEKMTPQGVRYFVDHISSICFVRLMYERFLDTKTTTWDDPRMPSNLADDVPQFKRDFRLKIIQFRAQPAMRAPPGPAYVPINIRRSNIFEDSFTEVMTKSPEMLKRRLQVTFQGEPGMDFGGVSREFFFLLSHEMFNPDFCLFEYSAHDSYTLQINPGSDVNPQHLNYFMFIGRVLGMAIFHKRFLDAYFISSVYKRMIGKSVTLQDLESVDPEMYRSLTWSLENDITDVIEETFTVQEERFGELLTIELIPGGTDIPVDEMNKQEWIMLKVEYILHKRVEQQYDAFMEGLHEFVPKELLAMFDEREVELLLGGIAQIDVEDWVKFTDYRGYEADDQVIRWFWQCIRSWPDEKKSRLLQFATGTSRVPVNGFKDLQGADGPRRFTIEKSGDPSMLPKSHTCFNRIDLPPYTDFQSLEHRLTMAIEESGGFEQE